MYNFEYCKKNKKEILENIYFSKREKIIYEKMILGFSTKEIQQSIGCSLRTIQYDINRIKKKIEDYKNNNNNQNFYVYIHIFPNNKKYVGVTENIIQRWGNDGIPYCQNIEMYKDIIKFGWENIQHEILLKTQSEYQARCLESKLIKLLNLTDENNGYNKMI